MSHDLARVLVIHRWAGSPEADWYPWLSSSVRDAQPAIAREVIVATMPTPKQPEIASWTHTVRTLLGDDPHELARTVLVGHSVGCQAALRALAALPAGLRVRATLCVAGWWTVDQPWPSIVPWIETPFDEARARASAGRLRVLLSDNDPFNRDADATRAQFIARLGAEVTVASGAKHFNQSMEPAVLAAVVALSQVSEPMSAGL
jgi:predicted alpha/beta hydrolase family esterase